MLDDLSYEEGSLSAGYRELPGFDELLVRYERTKTVDWRLWGRRNAADAVKKEPWVAFMILVHLIQTGTEHKEVLDWAMNLLLCGDPSLRVPQLRNQVNTSL